jgi:hypothetical protein
VVERQVFVDDTFLDPMITTTTCQELDEATKDSMASMTYRIEEQDMEIVRLKMELENSKKKIISCVINIVLFENFLR